MQAPNGLIANLFGPIEGKRHDSFMLGESGLQEQLRKIRKPNGEPYVLYGDPAHGVTNNIIAPFRGADLTAPQKHFNKAMSKVQVSVVWGFGKIAQHFALLDFKKKSQGSSSTCCKILYCCKFVNQLPYMFVWFCNWKVFQFSSPFLGNIPLKYKKLTSLIIQL